MAAPVALWLYAASSWGVEPAAVALPAEGETFALTPMDGLACFDTVVATLDDQCQFIFKPGLLLSGKLPECLAVEDLLIQIDDSNPANGAIADGPGIYRFVVTLKNSAACPGFSGCWGIVRVEDKTAPVILGPPNLTLALSCPNLDSIFNNPRSLRRTGRAQITDNCRNRIEDLNTFKDAIFYSNNCDTIVLRRAFTGQDRQGNVASYSQFITLVRPALSSVTIATNLTIDAGCTRNENFPKDANGNVAPTVTGYPYFVDAVDDSIQITANTRCGFSATYRDERFNVCAAAYKLIRTWTVIDWCRNTRREIKQTIKIGDVLPPTVACAAGADSLTLSTSPFGCTATWEVPAPQVSDACSSFDWTAEVFATRIRLVGNGRRLDTIREEVSLGAVNSRMPRRIIGGLPIGCHRVVYTVNDACENRATAECVVCVKDKISPTPKCDDQINLTLGGEGFAILDAADVDENSTDNCGVAKIEIRRWVERDSLSCVALAKPRYSDWAPRLLFTCCDLGQKIKVELRVTDRAGNQNICWSEVGIEDKLAPWCKSMPDQEIACTALPVNFNPLDSLALREWFGLPEFGDNCSATFIEFRPIVRLDRCGAGTITRRYTVRDGSGNMAEGVCTQTIRVVLRHSYNIKFPKDYVEFCKAPTPDTVQLRELGCDILALNISDKRFNGSGSSCYTIHRTFQVINWCEYEDGDQPVHVSRDVDCNGKGGDRDVWVLVRPDGTTYFDADNNENNTFPAAGVRPNRCDGLSNPAGYWKNSLQDPSIRSTGIWQYTQIIEVVDEQAPEVLVEDNLTFCTDNGSCNANVFLSVGVRDNCTSDPTFTTSFKISITRDSSFLETPWRIVGRYPKYIFTGIFAEGDYEVEIRVSDNCGNTTPATVRFKVVDCKPPGITCINGLSAELSRVAPNTDADGDGDIDTGAATLWAKDFVASASELCSNPIRYSINRKGERPNINQTALVVTCDDLGLLPVEIYAWDNANNPRSRQPDGTLGGPNYDYCETFLLVQDNQFGLCNSGPDTLKISGSIQTFRGRMMPGVKVRVGNLAEKTDWTDQNGAYTLRRLIQGYDYSVIPEKSDAQLNGVSTFDLILISQHILGLQPFNSPYQYLAADVNNSRSITTLDMILLRRAILNIDTTITTEGSGWIFVNQKFRFPRPDNPLATLAPRTLNINNLPGTTIDAGFVGIKLGDLNDNAVLGGDFSARARRAGEPALPLLLPDLALQPGQVYRIPVRLDSSAGGVVGFQFALQWPAAAFELEDVEYGLLQPEHLAWHARGGQEQLRVSWHQLPSAKNPEQPLFTLVVRARQPQALAKVLQLNERELAAEVYQGAPGAWQVGRLTLTAVLAVSSPTVTAPGLDLQVFPNPMADQALVKWTTYEAGQGTLRITNAMGQEVQQFQQWMPVGVNQQVLNRRDFPAPGLYYLRLSSGRQQSTVVLAVP